MTEVGQYSIGKSIGEGTFGKVCLAVHQSLRLDVAVKILEKRRIQDDQDVERVKREITILQMLHHPQVVQLYEITETETHIYLFMEYASGGELFEYIDKMKRISELEACKFMHQIISAVQYIHSLRIVHRDLKPENLLLTRAKDILVVDFGLSNIYEDTLRTACGSPCYAAPEMILGQEYNGLQTDLWSCGVIMFAMLCGYLPFEDSNTQVLYKKILNAEFHIPRFVSADARSLLKSILCVDPAKRFTIEQIKQHKWWQQCKLENPQMDPFKASYNKVVTSFLPNSIYASCVKKDIHRDKSEDVKTCDTGKQSIDSDSQFKCEINVKQEEAIAEIKEELEESPLLFRENKNSKDASEKNLPEFQFQHIPHQSNLQFESQTTPLKCSLQKSQDFLVPSSHDATSSKNDLLIPSNSELPSPAKFENLGESKLEQSVRSLTRQMSIKSIQSIKQLQQQQQVETKLFQLAEHPANIKKVSQQPKPAMPSGYKKITPQMMKQQRAKQGPSRSLHEPPPNLKIPQHPVQHQAPSTPVVQKQRATQQVKPLQSIKESSKEGVKEHQKEHTKETAKEVAKEGSKDPGKETTKENKLHLKNIPKPNVFQPKIQSAKTPIKSAHRPNHSLHLDPPQRFSTQADEQFNNIDLSTMTALEQFKHLLSLKKPPLMQSFNLQPPQKKNQGLQEQFKGMESHTGPMNIHQTTSKHPSLFLSGLQKYLSEKYNQQMLIPQKQEPYGLTFNMLGMAITIKLKRYEATDIFAVQITTNRKDQGEFEQFMADLVCNFKF